MNQSQDVSGRRMYLVTPNDQLRSRVSQFGDAELSELVAKPQAVMTEDLPFEAYFEGWRLVILHNCKLAFLKENLIECPIFEERVAADIFGSASLTEALFDCWWTAEEIDCIEIPTNWKSKKSDE